MNKMSKNQKIVITGITGLRNHGVEALVSTACTQLRKISPDCEITVLTLDPYYDQRLLANTAKAARTTLHVKKEPLKSKIKNSLTTAVGRGNAATIKMIKDADLVIASGGDVLSSDYGGLEAHLRPLRIAQDHGVSVAILGHSIGPFKTEEEAQSFVSVAEKSILVSAREPITYEYLTQDLKLEKSLVHNASDVAFLLPLPDSKIIDAMATHYGINPARNTVALAISQGMSRYASFNRTDHLNAITETTKFIIEELDCDVMLVPHVQDVSPGNDDRNITTDVLKTLAWHPRVKAIHGHHTASEYKGLISRCQLVFAERMHAGIAGLGTCVPTMPIGYSIKSYGIMKDFFGEDYLDHVFKTEDWLDTKASKDIIASAWNSRKQTSAALNTEINRIKRKALLNFEILKERI